MQIHCSECRQLIQADSDPSRMRPEQARYLEQQIESHLGIRDQAVAGEFLA